MNIFLRTFLLFKKLTSLTLLINFGRSNFLIYLTIFNSFLKLINSWKRVIILFTLKIRRIINNIIFPFTINRIINMIKRFFNDFIFLFNKIIINLIIIIFKNILIWIFQILIQIIMWNRFLRVISRQTITIKLFFFL